jgi:hypothetical protein
MKNKIALILSVILAVSALYQPLDAMQGQNKSQGQGKGTYQGRRGGGGHHRGQGQGSGGHRGRGQGGGGGQRRHHGGGRGRYGQNRGTGPADRTKYAHRGTGRGGNWHHGRGQGRRAHYDDNGRIWFFYNNAWLVTNEETDANGQLGTWIDNGAQWLPLGAKNDLRVGTPVKKQKPADLKPETTAEVQQVEKQIKEEETEAAEEETAGETETPEGEEMWETEWESQERY